MVFNFIKIISKQKIKKEIYKYHQPEDFMNLSSPEELKEVMILNHKKMWDWIYKETLKNKQKIYKLDYLNTYYKQIPNELINNCYLCTYKNILNQNCEDCLVEWETNYCYSLDSVYKKFTGENNWKKCAKYAKEIRDLKLK